MVRLATVFILVAALALISGCGPRQEPDTLLSNRISERAEAGAGTVIDPSALADFKWEQLYIFGPYTPVDEIHRALGFQWKDAGDTGIDRLEGIALLVFVMGGEVVAHVEHPRNQGDFATVARQEPWSTEDKFVLAGVDDLGQPWLEARPLDESAAP